MRKIFGLAAFALVSTLFLVGCMAGPAPAIASPSLEQSQVITVSGYGTALGEPDMATIIFGVNVVNEDLSDGVAEGNRAMAAVSETLAAHDIASQDIQTIGFSVWVEDRYSPDTGLPTGERIYHVDNQVRVIVRDIDQVETIIDAALDSGANNINGLNFGISDTSALESEARAEAIADAQTIATEIAESLGIELGEVISVSDSNSGIQPYIDFGGFGVGGGGGGGADVSEGQLLINAYVSMTFAIK
jgi:uncharacterized protein YggE